MSKKKFFIILSILVFLLPIFKINAQNTNAGFVSGNIWYSQDPFKEGDNIKIHTIIYNTDSRELLGTVYFFDKTLFLGNRSLSVPPKASVDVSIDWKVTAGDHAIFAQIQNAKFLLASGKYEEATLGDTKSEESKRTVEKINNQDSINTNLLTNTADNSIVKIIKDSTPAFVTKSIDATTNTLENIRNNINTNSTQNKKAAQTEIQKINNVGKTTDTKTNAKNPTNNTKKVETSTNFNFFLKPFTYAKLFFFSLFSFITGTKIIFYAVIILLIVFILRFLWKLIF